MRPAAAPRPGTGWCASARTPEKRPRLGPRPRGRHDPVRDSLRDRPPGAESPRAMTRVLEAIGRAVLRIFEEFGGFFSMLGRVAFWGGRPPYAVPGVLRQMVRVGFDSIPVVLVTP